MRLIRVAPSTRFDLHKICTCRGVMPHLSAASWTVIYPYIANTSQIANTKSHYNYIRLSEIKQVRICNLQKKKRRPQGTILPTGGIRSTLSLLQISNILLRQLTGRFPALCAVRGVQLETEPSFPDFKCKATVFVVVHLIWPGFCSAFHLTRWEMMESCPRARDTRMSSRRRPSGC